MTQLFKNFASAKLAAPVSPGDTSITIDVTRADRFPVANTGTNPVNTTGQDWFKLVLQDINDNTEIVYVRTRTLGSGVLSNVIRAREGTVALSFPLGSVVGLRATAKDFEDALAVILSAGATGLALLQAANTDAAQGSIGMTTLGKALATAVDDEDVRTLIQAAIAGANNDITSLSALTWLAAAATLGNGGPLIGYRNIPQRIVSANTTTVADDAGKHLLHPSADTTARTWTIDSNANVPYPIGTAITFVNQNGAGVLTIGITADTMRLAGAGTTGNRTLAANGMATALKLTATEWIISGTGLT